MKKWLFIVVFVIAAFCAYNYVFKNHRDIATETSSFNVTAKNLINEFSINPTDSETKYLNKTIEITGSISQIITNSITLNEKVFCQFSDKTLIEEKNNSQIKIKGRFIGYDDLLEEIKLDQCSIID